MGYGCEDGLGSSVHTLPMILLELLGLFGGPFLLLCLSVDSFPLPKDNCITDNFPLHISYIGFGFEVESDDSSERME